jgi:DNA topoisomerase-1
MVVDFLTRFFEETVTPRFTAHLEQDLDQIEEGEMTRIDALDEFYRPFSARLEALERQIEQGGNQVFRVLSDVVCDRCGAPMELRHWKGSHFLGCSNYPECKNTINLPPDLAIRYEGDSVLVKDALEAHAEETAERIPCTTCGGEMEMRSGRYGRYFKCLDPECGATAPISTGVRCPSCGKGEIVEKYSAKRRRTFYSCNRYPDCRYATSDKPLGVCPACDSGVLIEKSGELRCTNKECGHTEPIDAA